MAKDAYKFLIPLLAVSAIFLALACLGDNLFLWAAVPALLISAFVAFFFRDPDRAIDPAENTIVSPVDGKVVSIAANNEGFTVSIFLSIFDVHVNRAPIGGKIITQEYRSGKFLVAWDERASLENEQVQMTFEGFKTIKISLIAGIIARRIIPYTRKGDEVAKGDRIALIRFGSRADVLIPKDCQVVVGKGDRVKGGLTVLATTGE